MSQTVNRQPPRFVPTLTDVIAEQATPALSAAPEREQLSHHTVVGESTHLGWEASHASHSASSVLTDESLASEQAEARNTDAWLAAAQSVESKVMARLDASLEERLHYAMADVVQLHSQSLYQALRQDLERVVNAAVHEAVAQELAHMRRQSSS